MATLKMIGFRCYDDEHIFSFKPGQVITIKGRSGVGKTTIFEAIQWVLYRYPTTGIDPRSGKSKNTYVSLAFDTGLLIERKKNPGLLRLTHPDRSVEEDDIAQASIIQLFGDKDIWRTCAYLPQNENCPLLSFSNIQRMDILESLTFLSEKPEEDLDRITEEIKRIQDVYNKSSSQLEVLKEKLSSISLPDQPENLIADQETKEKAKKEKERLAGKIKTLEGEKAIAEDKKKQKKKLEADLKKSQESLAKLRVASWDDLTKKEEEYKHIQAELVQAEKAEITTGMVAKRDNLAAKIKQMAIPEREYTRSEYEEILHNEKKIIEEEKIASNWKIPYAETKVKDRIKQLEGIIDSQREAQIWKKIIEIESKLEVLTGKEVSQEDLDKARQELANLERSADIIKCPSCNRSLRYLRNILVLAETSPVPVERLNKLKKAFAEMEQAYRQTQQVKVLTGQRDSLLETVKTDGPPEQIYDLKKLETELNSLRAMTFPAKSQVTSSQIRLNQEYFSLKKDLTQVEEELTRYEILPVEKSCSELKTTTRLLQDEIKSLRELLPKRSSTLDQIKRLEDELLAISCDPVDYDTEITQLQTRIDAIDQAMDECRLAEQFLELEKEVIAKEDEVNLNNKELSAAIRLKDLAHREISEIINDKISTINLSLTDICNRIFLEPITVELDMLKTTKTTKVTKPCVHLKIWYKGGEYDSISQLSGGEGKRISIALSLALAQLNFFPLILLDECLNGLDDELKENVLETIKTVCSQKTVLVISHDSLDGYFDDAINLKD